MRHTDIPRERLQRYAIAAAEEGRVADLQLRANEALRDIPHLLEAGEVELAGGAVTVALRTILLRAATPAGSEGVGAETDLSIKERSTFALDHLGAPLAAVMVGAAVAHERGAHMGQDGAEHSGGRA